MGNSSTCCGGKLVCQDCGKMATYRGIYCISSTKFSPKQKTFTRANVKICAEFQSLPDEMAQYFIQAKFSQHSFEFVIVLDQGLQKKRQVEFLFLGCDKCMTSGVKQHFEYSASGF